MVVFVINFVLNKQKLHHHEKDYYTTTHNTYFALGNGSAAIQGILLDMG